VPGRARRAVTAAGAARRAPRGASVEPPARAVAVAGDEPHGAGAWTLGAAERSRNGRGARRLDVDDQVEAGGGGGRRAYARVATGLDVGAAARAATATSVVVGLWQVLH